MQFTNLAVSLLPFISLGFAVDQRDTSKAITASPRGFVEDIESYLTTLCLSSCVLNAAPNQTEAEVDACRFCEVLFDTLPDPTVPQSSTHAGTLTLTFTSSLPMFTSISGKLSSRATQQASDSTTTIILGSSTLPVTSSTTTTYQIVPAPTTTTMTTTARGSTKTEHITHIGISTVPASGSLNPMTTIVGTAQLTLATGVGYSMVLGQHVEQTEAVAQNAGGMKLSAFSSLSLVAMTLGFFMA